MRRNKSRFSWGFTPNPKKRSALLRASVRGAVLVEYTLLLTAFAIPAMMGIAAGGVAMMKDYQEARDSLLLPFP